MQTRRQFLRTTTVAVAGGLLTNRAGFAGESDGLGPLLPRRVLMRNGERTTVVGLGGYHVGKAQDPVLAQQLIEKALELGIRFFDNARGYESGHSEEFYGRFLTPLYRDHVFLMTKSAAKDGPSARRDLESSLKALNTTHLDLWQMHDMYDLADVDRRIGAGVLDELLKAKAEGKTRYVGFSGHTNPKTHLYFLSKLKEKGIELDTVQMPLNLCDPHYESFELGVLPVLLERKYGVLAMKTMAGGSMMGKAIDTTPREIAEKGIPHVQDEAKISNSDMHRYVYSRPASVLITGCETVPQLEENVRVVRESPPLTAPETERLLAATKPYGGNIVENYKRTF